MQGLVGSCEDFLVFSPTKVGAVGEFGVEQGQHLASVSPASLSLLSRGWTTRG